MTTFASTIETPIGKISIIASDRGLIAIQYNQTVEGFPQNHISVEASKQLQEYFNGDRTAFDLPLDLKGTDFEIRVWKYLMTIDYGQVTNYATVAKTVSSIKAVRAVGRANGKNPIPIIIPCHRVVGSDGSLTGYALGIEVKRFLLEKEKPGRFSKQLSLEF